MATNDNECSLRENHPNEGIREKNENKNGILIHTDIQLQNVDGTIQNKAEERVVHFKSSKFC